MYDLCRVVKGLERRKTNICDTLLTPLCAVCIFMCLYVCPVCLCKKKFVPVPSLHIDVEKCGGEVKEGGGGGGNGLVRGFCVLCVSFVCFVWTCASVVCLDVCGCPCLFLVVVLFPSLSIDQSHTISRSIRIYEKKQLKEKEVDTLISTYKRYRLFQFLFLFFPPFLFFFGQPYTCFDFLILCACVCSLYIHITHRSLIIL
jgi:hypothetical protein